MGIPSSELDNAFKLCESREQQFDRIRVCMVTFALASGIITPASVKAMPIICFISG